MPTPKEKLREEIRPVFQDTIAQISLWHSFPIGVGTAAQKTSRKLSLQRINQTIGAQ